MKNFPLSFVFLLVIALGHLTTAFPTIVAGQTINETDQPQVFPVLNFHAETGQVYSAGYNYGPNSTTYWSIDEPIITSTNYYSVTPAVQCAPVDPNCKNPTLMVVFSVAQFCDGESYQLSAFTGGSPNAFIFGSGFRAPRQI